MSIGRDFIGKYRYVRLIRAGATCQILEVENQENSRRVALKILQKEFLDNKEQIAQLKHEYEVGHKMRHPNVEEVYEFNYDRELPFLVLELLEGKNVKLMLRGGVASLEPMMYKIIDQAAEGLRYFHSQGWIHRDIKPDNFLLLDDGRVKLLDFAIAVKPATGFAKLFGGKSSGKVAGTRSYMSPEQILNQPLDMRADIYSFGCMLYELVTGKTPYTGATSDDLLSKHLNQPVPAPTMINPMLTAEFNTLVMNLMAKNRDKRPRSMDEFLKTFRSVRIFKAKKIV